MSEHTRSGKLSRRREVNEVGTFIMPILEMRNKVKDTRLLKATIATERARFKS